MNIQGIYLQWDLFAELEEEYNLNGQEYIDYSIEITYDRDPGEIASNHCLPITVKLNWMLHNSIKLVSEIDSIKITNLTKKEILSSSEEDFKKMVDDRLVNNKLLINLTI